jgi:hypothetical protein
MNNYRCTQCGFLNWATADQCKRCRLPISANNQPQFSPQPPMQNTIVAATPQTAVQAQYVQPQNYQTPNYQNRQNYQNSNYQTSPQYQQHQQRAFSGYNNSQQVNYNTGTSNTIFVDNEEIEKAKKQVKAGWIAGIVWASLLALVTVFLAFMPMFIGTRQNPALKGLNDESVAMVSRIVSGVMMILTIIIGILSYGIRQNSLACAAILTILSGLSVFSSLFEKDLGGTVFGILFFVLFCVSVNGINTLKKYGQIE